MKHTLSLHDALPIYPRSTSTAPLSAFRTRREQVFHRKCLTRRIGCLTFAGTKRKGYGNQSRGRGGTGRRKRSEEHTSELQSRQYLVCRLLLEKKKY